jgi:pyrroline-5-carboxylate reductase
MKIFFLGGGNMANALIGGMMRQGFANTDISVVELNTDNRQALKEQFNVDVFASACECNWRTADVVILAVKPQQMKEALAPLSGQLQHALVISIAAGLTMETLARWLGNYRRIVRCMPNTPSLIGAGMTGLCALTDVSMNEKLAAERILQAVGKTMWVEEENSLDGVTAISGSGPAYVFLFIEALQEAATELGFNPEEARQLALETVLGAAQLAAQSPEPASLLRERVTSKGGTTAAALEVMGKFGVKAGIIAGAHAAALRSAELGHILGSQD